jgi:REP element-mobilizing transposase RayT
VVGAVTAPYRVVGAVTAPYRVVGAVTAPLQGHILRSWLAADPRRTGPILAPRIEHPAHTVLMAKRHRLREPPMPYDPYRHHRRSIRLPERDYAQAGVYYVTICTHGREHLLGDVVDGAIRFSAYGRIAADWWMKIDDHFANAALGNYVIMPNHVHGIVVLRPPAPPAPRRTLGQIIAYFKHQSTKAVNQLRGTPRQPLWQRNYYERVVRAGELARIEAYILSNPEAWLRDHENLDPMP